MCVCLGKVARYVCVCLGKVARVCVCALVR